MGLFGKKKSPMDCPECKTKNSIVFTPNDDVAECRSPTCQRQVRTGYEDDIRERIQKDCNGVLQYPRFAVARAIGYCSAIYGMATHGEVFAGDRIETHLAKLAGENGKFRGGSPGQVELVRGTQISRSIRGVIDRRHGYLMTVVTGKQNGSDFQQIYIAFRGSRSDKGDDANPANAGYDTVDGEEYNADYMANFTSHFTNPKWAPHVGMRQGFVELYESMELDIRKNLETQLGRYPNAAVIVTGHSLGAAVAVVCAHQLQHYYYDRISSRGPFCFPFCTPRVGNAKFGFDFQANVASKLFTMPGEPNPGFRYHRCMSFVMNNDPVSNGAKYGWKGDRMDDPNSKGTEWAKHGGGGNALATVKKAVYTTALVKKKNTKIIYYQTPNRYRLGWYKPSNIHQYSALQKDFLGTVLFKT